ncbi:pesticidal crystal cry8Ba protein [Tasmannia lanceolata]|uniref:pesticidal crystal cry8Ba protein n=1 Tax=Tasmannia lanceolata TaxID=3420 RepID=UPI0040646FCB
MFTEGLDPNALRWVRQGSRIEPVHNFRTGGRGFGLPPPAKFRSGHLPSRVIPVSHSIPIDAEDSGFGSDMEETTDSEEDIYAGRYSLDSSPQDNVEARVPNGTVHRYATPSSRQQHYASDNVYSDFSSSRETARQQPVHTTERTGGLNGRYPVGQNDYTEDETSDSAGSSEFATRMESKSCGVPLRGSYPAESYASNVPLRADVEASAAKGPHGRDPLTDKLPDVDVPSAPPFNGSGLDINQGATQVGATRPCGTPCTADSDNSSIKKEANISKSIASGVGTQDQCTRATSGVEAAVSSGPLPARVPTFHASGQGPWHAVLAYDACVRLCLNSWARGCMEAPIFLENECALLRTAFGLQQILLQSEEELLAKRSSELVSEGAAPKPKKTIGKMKVQVRKVRMSPYMPPGCSFASLKPPTVRLESLRYRISSLRSSLSAGWEALRNVRVLPRTHANASFSRHSLAYVQASTQYIKQVSSLLKIGVTTLRNSSSYDIVQETYSCLLRLKSSTEEDAVRMQPGSSETHVFFPDSLGDDLIVEVYDSKGKSCGRVLAQVATIAEVPGDKLRWWSIYHEPEHELVGRLQLYINYTTSPDENGSLKCGSIAETVAYDFLLEVAMKVQHFQQRNLLLHGSWKWILTEFASYYGVSDAYTKLRYLSYVIDVATPTADCLTLVHDLLLPVILKSRSKSTLSHQENRILGEIEEQIEQILGLAFENYKSLDESSLSGMMDVFRPATGSPAPALVPAIKLYTLLHDILSPETQLKLCSYFQAAAKKRSRRQLIETDEFVAGNGEGTSTDALTHSTAYQKMKALCLNIRNEVYTDIEIHEQHVLPSFIDLPNISASIYSVELCNRLRAFLVACPPTSPSQPVADLVIATADFQRDLESWNICPVKGGVDAKELFHLYIILWIQDKRLSLLESCKLDKVKWSGVTTQHSTTPFVDDMYDRLKETMNEYEIIMCRWPEYTFVLENAIADIEKAVVEALEKQYADVLAPLKDTLTPKKFGLKYVQKLANLNSIHPYTVPEELGILLNTMKRLLDVLLPKIEIQLKSWGSCIPDGGRAIAGERLGEVTVSLRSKFRNYQQAVVEKLSENTRLQGVTKLKKIIQDSKENVTESDIRTRMQPLKDQLTKTIDHLHTVFATHVFVSVCREYWDRMGEDVLSFLKNRKENRSWYKSSRVTVTILDDTFASQMQQLLGNTLQEKDLEPPRSIMEVRSMLCKDAPNHKDSNYYY